MSSTQHPSVRRQLVGATLGTAWRMALPGLVLASIGLVIDARLHEGPLLTLIGLATGLLLSMRLVRSLVGQLS